ncbi:class I SAM-dependent methyltransferase [Endozoicomonas sp.]|uniref:class I SAM-dependent methyltransferase n=1 Tax=Endozoicomonas sp. TaxID=1892382 RepID=UPI0028883BC5|nr:class I SAM-dependent methyltransferase [Endozoicomonas sp.]
MIQPKPISFSEAERLSVIFDSENREEWQGTSHILNTLNLRPDMVVADVGAGTGYFTHLFSELLPEGMVYALDPEPNMISYMEKRFADGGQTNIQPRVSEHLDPRLPAGLDVVFLANVYRFIKQREMFLANLYKQVSHGTLIMFVDFRGSHARVSPHQAMNEVTQSGFVIEDMDINGCPDHYILRFRKPLAA